MRPLYHVFRRCWRICVVAAVLAGSLLVAHPGPAYASDGSTKALTPEVARATLAQRLVPHTSVGIEPATNQVVLTIADAADQTDGLVSAARQFGSAVRVERIPGGFHTLVKIRGGNGIMDVNGPGTCSLGFNVTGAKMLTAGHCTKVIAAWKKETGGAFIGPSIASNFPGTDFGLIRNDGGINQPGEVGLFEDGSGHDITNAGTPTVGQIACKSGRTTHITCGQITRVGVTINVEEGPVSGLAESLACAQEGDSGGPLYIGSIALGLTSASTTLPCGHASFRSYFQPVIPALNTYGVWVY
jgi:streptogrisin D